MQHDAAALAGWLWKSPAAFRMYLRGQSAVRLTEYSARATLMPVGHQLALDDELEFRSERTWMDDGAVEVA